MITTASYGGGGRCRGLVQWSGGRCRGTLIPLPGSEPMWLREGVHSDLSWLNNWWRSAWSHTAWFPEGEIVYQQYQLLQSCLLHPLPSSPPSTHPIFPLPTPFHPPASPTVSPSPECLEKCWARRHRPSHRCYCATTLSGLPWSTFYDSR